MRSQDSNNAASFHLILRGEGADPLDEELCEGVGRWRERKEKR